MSSMFFMSSRRRHTRLQGDWSSDVCSSDLPDPAERPRFREVPVPEVLRAPEAPGIADLLPEDERIDGGDRSEEHTSELQSPCNLVCRLLLEKKKKIHGLRMPTAHSREPCHC